MAAGRYLLAYQDCAHPGRYLPEWSGGAHVPTMASQLTVSGGRVTTAGVVALQPASQAALLHQPPAARLARAEGLPSAGTRWGGISGHLVGPGGHPASGTCVEVHFRGGWEGIPVSRKGNWDTGRNLPSGQYTVLFAGVTCESNPGNWAPQWYKHQVKESKATKITIKAGKVTRHIDATLWHGGILAGEVLSRSGANVYNTCVVLLSRHGHFLALQQSRHDGAYSFRGMPTGSYLLQFSPDCAGPSKYLPQFWKNTTSFKKALPIKVRLRRTVSGIDPRLLTGATITGTVRSDTAADSPLSGVCVNTWANGASTNHDGRYRIEGLPTGKYAVSFFPGCHSNANYLAGNYPHRLHVVDGKTYRGVDGRLRPGAIISGTVTDVAGEPLRDIGVSYTGNGAFDETCTSATGSYRLFPLPPGSYTVTFANDGCGNHGSYAPQYYPDQTQPGGAVPVKVSYGQRVTGIDARMRPGAIITGTVSNRAGQPQPRICANEQVPGNAYDSIEIGFPVGGSDAATDSSGVYHIRNLVPGRYAVEFGPCGNADVQDSWFGGTSRSPIGDIVTVTSAETVGGVNGVMSPGGGIAGTIRSNAGKRLDSICAEAVNRRTRAVSLTMYPSSSYEIGQLPPGRYTVEFYSCLNKNYAIQWYSGKLGPGKAATVTVSAGHVTRGINAAMTKGGELSGRITAQATGAPVRDFCVTASTASGSYFGWGQTNRDGDYVVAGLNAGRYALSLSNCYPTRSSLADLTTRRTVQVTARRRVTGFNAALPVGGSISGRVLAGTPMATPQNSGCVVVYPLSSQSIEYGTYVGDSGRYSVTNLLAGSYRVYFDPVTDCDYSVGGLRPRWYGNSATRAKAAIVTVKAGQASTGISATLPTDGSISGTVTAASSGSSLTGVCVLAVPKTTGRAASFTATSAGSYRLIGLAPGSYTVKFSSGCGATGYATQWWKDASRAATATSIIIRTGHVTGGINAPLDK